VRILNLYAGLGGNRLKWDDVEVTALEMNEEIAAVYQQHNPGDTVLIEDAHEYLLKNHADFDMVWSSPPCQSHSRFIRSGRNRKPVYPDMKLYEEILFLKHNFKGLWVVENVKPYYKPLIEPLELGRHCFWSNFTISPCHIPNFGSFITTGTVAGSEDLKDWVDIHYEGNIYYDGNHDPCQVLRNCIHPDVGNHVLGCAKEEIRNNQINGEGD